MNGLIKAGFLHPWWVTMNRPREGQRWILIVPYIPNLTIKGTIVKLHHGLFAIQLRHLFLV